MKCFYRDGMADRKLWLTAAAAYHQEWVAGHMVPAWERSEQASMNRPHMLLVYPIIQQRGAKLSLCKSESESTLHILTEWQVASRESA